MEFIGLTNIILMKIYNDCISGNDHNGIDSIERIALPATKLITEMKGCNGTQNDTCINAISLSHLILFCFPCLSPKRFELQYMSLVFSFGLYPYQIKQLLWTIINPKNFPSFLSGVKSQHIKDLKISD